MKKSLNFLLLCMISIISAGTSLHAKPIRILVITGGHSYKTVEFNLMLASLGDNISFEIAELPAAFDMFLPENRGKYDALVFYHMWQKITDEQAKNFSECISQGKPLVALHHSICAFDDWPEYFNIIGGKYFHKPTTVNGKEFAACTYKHDLQMRIRIADKKHPVTKGINNFELFDEAYKGYYIEEGVTTLLTTDSSDSNAIIGWAKKYGKAKIVTLQSGHDVPTFESPDFRKLLKQAIEYVAK